MGLFKTGLATVILLPVGIALALVGFFTDIPVLRSPLQVFGIFALGVAALQGQRLVAGWQKMLDEA